MPISLNFEQYHCNNQGAPWVVLIHGLFGNLDNLAALRRHLTDAFNVIAIDLPDHGESPWVDTFTLADCVSALVQVLDDQQIDKCHIVGHSLGGKVAMLTALTHPDRVDTLVPMDIAPVTYPPHHQAVFAGLKKVDLSAISGRKEADNVMQSEIKIPGVRQFLLKSLYQDDTGHWQWRFNVTGLEKDYANVGGFTVPDNAQFTGKVTFIKGGESDYITRAHQTVIGQYFPNAKAKIVEGVGHWLHAEKPQVVNGLVERALLD
ncbi:alpha/beta fold hydrolase [uncultured Alteromonas sp.]|jgi:esterase|uniref:alpha/beta fold hydrolase n=1 Tax=uncultured Alteromonas sp. TaxID=179113 RepID=UPI00345DE2CA